MRTGDASSPWPCEILADEIFKVANMAEPPELGAVSEWYSGFLIPENAEVLQSSTLQ